MSGKRERKQRHEADVALVEDEGTGQREYRTGYRDGWIEALHCLSGLLEIRPPQFEDAYDQCCDHYDLITAWIEGDCSQPVPPPKLLKLASLRPAGGGR